MLNYIRKNIEKAQEQAKTKLTLILDNLGYKLVTDIHNTDGIETRIYQWKNTNTKHCIQLIWDGKENWFDLGGFKYTNNLNYLKATQILLVPIRREKLFNRKKYLNNVIEKLIEALIGNNNHFDFDFYYTNILNSIILFTYNSVKLKEMAPILLDPLTELYEELEYAFTPVCFETVFRVGLIENSLKNELFTFKKVVDEIPKEIWDYEFIDNHEAWASIREKANDLLNKLGIISRIYNIKYTTIYDIEGNILNQGK